jgi:hypothetical protein
LDKATNAYSIITVPTKKKKWLRGQRIGGTDVRYNRMVLGISGGGVMMEPSYEELKSRVAELEKQGGGRRTGSLEFRVGEKGGVSVYGLGRFPVTLYYEQWTRLLDAGEKLRSFLEEAKTDGKLKLKER